MFDVGPVAQLPCFPFRPGRDGPGGDDHTRGHLAAGRGAQQYELRVELGDGIPPSIGPPQWNSSAPGVVSVTPGGLATAVAPGTATLSVQVRGGRDSLAIRATD